jgi:hypothetical protein
MIHTLADMVLRRVRTASARPSEEPTKGRDATTHAKATTLGCGPDPPRVSPSTDSHATDRPPPRDEPPSPEALVALLADVTLRSAPILAIRKEITHDIQDP